MSEKDKTPLSSKDIEQIRAMAESIKYGTITLVFQDGHLIQIERNEKIRMLKS